MLQQETFLFTFICFVAFVHGAKGKEINKNGNFRNKSYFKSFASLSVLDKLMQGFQTAKKTADDQN